jgi:hypothetical protein
MNVKKSCFLCKSNIFTDGEWRRVWQTSHPEEDQRELSTDSVRIFSCRFVQGFRTRYWIIYEELIGPRLFSLGKSQALRYTCTVATTYPPPSIHAMFSFQVLQDWFYMGGVWGKDLFVYFIRSQRETIHPPNNWYGSGGMNEWKSSFIDMEQILYSETVQPWHVDMWRKIRLKTVSRIFD